MLPTANRSLQELVSMWVPYLVPAFLAYGVFPGEYSHPEADLVLSYPVALPAPDQLQPLPQWREHVRPCPCGREWCLEKRRGGKYCRNT